MTLLAKISTSIPVFAANWSVGADKPATIKDFAVVFENIAQTVVYFAGVVFLIMFIKGGFNYLTSGGDPKKTAKATSGITVAIIGIVGVIISFLIIKLIDTFTGVNVTEFKIGE